MADITGTEAGDGIQGTDGDDTIHGLGGHDHIEGLAGNDWLWGGSGADTLKSGTGNDVLYGEAGDDYLWADGAGNKTMSGGADNDILFINREDTGAGQLAVDGGAGDDLLSYSSSTMAGGVFSRTVGADVLTADLGDGDDFAALSGGHIFTIGLGAGNDYIQYAPQSTNLQITLGTGRDLVVPTHFVPGAAGSVSITDFSAGDSGDRFIVDDYLIGEFFGWAGANPFATGLMRLVQSGPDTLLQYDTPGDGIVSYMTLASLAGVTASALTQANFGFSPDGSNPVGRTINGSALIDTMYGEGGNDTLSGLGGNDKLYGYAGNDILLGGDDDDEIDGGIGNDQLVGGAGRDTLFDWYGSDIFSGGDGNDTINANRGVSLVSSTINIDGGADGDWLTYWSFEHKTDTVTLLGGDGGDFITAGIAANITIDAGNGDDQVDIFLRNGAVTIKLGAGTDRLWIQQPNQLGFAQTSAILVTDFVTAAGGDQLYPQQIMASNVSGWNGVDNPFATGHLRMLQQGSDAVLQLDADGGGDGFVSILRLANVQASALTGNAWNYFSPDRIYLAGNETNETLSGSAANDGLAGFGGADTLTGGLGNDIIDGGSNVDTAVVAGNRSAYTVTQTSFGVFGVVGPDGSDTLKNVEYLKFDDQTLRLRPGTGTSVDFSGTPSSYMGAIRDFDANDLGFVSGWKHIGAADVNGDGDVDQILVNRTIGRFAEVGTAPDGLVYFGDYGWAGETRVVGIYIDPLVQSGQIASGSDHDSQRRFQNDLAIENINRVLGAGDYDHDGLQEVYFGLTDGTAYLHAYMHADGNIRYANYQSQQQVIDFLGTNGWAASTYDGWFG